MQRGTCLMVCALALAPAQELPWWRVTRMAGPGEPAGPLPGLRVYLRSPQGMAADDQGNLFIADPGSHVVRRLSAEGVLTTVAGAGVPGYAGDGGPAVQAALLAPEDVRLDAEGNLWIADTGNARIRKVDGAGVIQTVVSAALAPNRMRSPSGLAFHTNGDLLWSDAALHLVARRDRAGNIRLLAGTGVRGTTGDDGMAVSAQLYAPRGLEVDRFGNLYICEPGTNRVRVVNPEGIIRRFAGSGEPSSYGDGLPAAQAGIVAPWDLALDEAENVYIAEAGAHRVRRVARSGLISSAVGGGFGVGSEGEPAAGSKLNTPRGLASAAGAVWIADTGNLRVRRFPLLQQTIRSLAGGVPDVFRDGQPALPIPVTVAAVSGDRNGLIYVFDSLRSSLYRIDATGRWNRVAGNEQPGMPEADSRPALATSLPPTITSLAWHESGALYLADGSQVWRLEAGALNRLAGTGRAGDQGDGGLAVEATFRSISALATDPLGVLYVADAGASRVRQIERGRISPTPVLVRAPAALATDLDLNLYIADATFRVYRLTRTGDFRAVAGNGLEGSTGDGGPALAASFGLITSMGADRDGNLFVYDSGGRRVRRISREGRVDPVAGGGGLLLNDGGLATSLTLGGNVRISVDPDAGVVLAQETVVSQLRPAAGRPCTWQVTPAQIEVPAGGGEIALAVTASADGCGWSAQINVDWVQILEGSPNWRSGTLRLRLRPNTGPVRSATLLVGGVAVAVRQATSAPPIPLLAPAGAVVNGASFQAEIAAGAWVTVRGVNLAEGPSEGRSWRPEEILNGVLPVELDGVRVSFNGVPAAISYVSPAQLNVQAPEGLPEGAVTVSVVTARGTAAGSALVAPVAPGLFTGAREPDGSRVYAAAVFALPEQDGFATYVGKPELLPGVRARIAAPGDLVSVYGTGFGPTEPLRPSGRVIDPAPVAARVTATLGAVQCDVLYAGLTAAGLNQVNLRIPPIPEGEHLLVLSVGGKPTQRGVFLSVR